MTLRQCVDTGFLALTLLASAELASAAPRFERVLDTPCRALALDREPYWAALGEDAVTLSDKRGVRREELPAALRGKPAELGIFFGRDYRVRLAGSAPGAAGREAIYLRSLPQGLRPAPDELGPLGRAGAPGLLAVLGTADPEIVCRLELDCLIKRISGWTKVTAPRGLDRVGLSPDGGWAIAGKTFYSVGRDFVPVPAPGPWQRASDGFLRHGHASVVEHDAHLMHHFDGQSWHTSPSPIAGPRSLWGNEQTLWIAGDGGAAYYGEGAFRPLPGPRHIAQVLARSESDVWLCSADGVFRSSTRQVGLASTDRERRE